LLQMLWLLLLPFFHQHVLGSNQGEVSTQQRAGAVLCSESRDSHRHCVPWLLAGCCVLERMRETGAMVRLMRLLSVRWALIADVTPCCCDSLLDHHAPRLRIA
jgi:hypothetical protein